MKFHLISPRQARGGAASLLATALLATFSASAQAPMDIRVALVIGNSAYPASPLVNPANDAKAMSETLRTLGFTVVELRDGQKSQMTEAINKVRDTLKGKQGVGMLYYAGHGLQQDWHNYMVPVNASLNSAADVPLQTVDINLVIDAFKAAGNRMNIVVLDACRDNPFAGTASGKGLAQQDAPPGTFLAYATAPGNVAEDGDVKSGNGLYTQFLLQELKKPVAKIEDVFKRVRFNVRKQSQGRQIPWESTSLEDDFYFSAGKPVQAKSDDSSREAAFDQEKADWDRIADSKRAEDFYAFLQKYPNGTISEVAQAALERLDKSRTLAVANKDGIVQGAGVVRYRLGDTHGVVVKDGLTGVEKSRGRQIVTKVADGVVELNDGRALLSPEGGTIHNQFIANFSPPRLDLPATDYVVGKKWAFRTIQTNRNGNRFWVEGKVNIAALEDVKIGIGTFKTYRVELESQSQSGERVKLTRWMEPDWGFPIKMVREILPRDGTRVLEIYEMLGRKRGNG
jgi:hypothetical protein